MSVPTKLSFLIASISCIFLFSSMQIFKTWLSSSNSRTLLGGLLGSFLFTLALTAVGNLETLLFGKSHSVRLFPEVLFAMLVAFSASATVHRICGTSCLLLSAVSLYYVNKYSQKVYAQTAPQPVTAGKKRRN